MSQNVTHLNIVKSTQKTDEACNGLLGQIGNLSVRLARTEDEIIAAQKIRFEVFYKEFGAQATDDVLKIQRDVDPFDAYCDHLIVIDDAIKGTEIQKIVGTYRLMQTHHAKAAGGYYSADEFATASLMMRNPERKFLELGRSCVLPAYRSKRSIEILWQGIWAYCNAYEIDVMMGCASFNGTVPAKHAQALSFLHHHASVDEKWHIAPVAGRHVQMDLMPPEAIHMKAAIAALPPLIKGYLRLGAKFGDGAVIDHAFNTIDVMVVLPTEHISPRYKAHYGEDANRFAA